jgi:hypothetical protein
MNGPLIGILMRAFGVLLIGLAVFRGIKGQYRSDDSTGMTEVLDRSRNPVRFWGQLLVQAVIGVVLALGVIKI